MQMSRLEETCQKMVARAVRKFASGSGDQQNLSTGRISSNDLIDR
jgi:hypothetical protein